MRSAALILDDGMYSFFETNTASMPSSLLGAVRSGQDDVFALAAQTLIKTNTGVRWGLHNGVWAFGAKSFVDYIRQLASYTLEGIAQQIACPMLVMEAEGKNPSRAKHKE